MHERWRILTLLALSLLAAPLAQATTVSPPANLGHLARISGAVVFAQAIESRVEEGSSLPYTITRFMALQRVAGANPGLIFEVREPGGAGKRRGAAVAGAARFEAGRNYLLFLDPAPEHRWRSKMMAYGLLVQARGSDVLAPLPESQDVGVFSRKSFEPPGAFHRDALLRHLRDVARGATWDRRRAQPAGAAAASENQSELVKATFTALAAPSSCRFLADSGDTLPIRWFGFEQGTTTVTVAPTTPGQTGISDGGVSAVQQGAASWTNHADSVINLVAGSARPRNVTCTGGFDRDPGGVLFNDPCGDIADFASCAAAGAIFSFGGVFFNSGTLPYDGAQWHPATSTWVIINNGTECMGETDFKEVVAHEMGHTQGFGHHAPPNPADALMSENPKRDGLGPALRIVDKACASFAYHTFLDVPYNYFAWRFIEAVENAGVMGSCGTGNFCPADLVTRGSMALFLLKAKEGAGYVPPPCTTPTFSDVPCSDPLAPWIEELVRRNVTAGCGGGQYCPNNIVTRNQMAVFLIKTFEGPAFVPPACTTPPFNDVPCSSPFAPWVKLITDRGITAGCGGGNYCPALEVNRAQMSVFMTQTFALPAPPPPLP